jgi:hypothetical protein
VPNQLLTNIRDVEIAPQRFPDDLARRVIRLSWRLGSCR